MKHPITRRDLLGTASLAGVGFWLTGGSARADSKSPNEKLNIACIGCGGQGGGHVDKAAGQNLVALCDVDERRAAERFERYDRAAKFHDFRQMFDRMHKEIDAVYVATPDHVHAPASVMAMRLGKGVYCEKPLAHNIHEVRLMARVAAEQKVATQMGNQGHSSRGCRSLVEAIRSGVVGRITEAHAWCPKAFSADRRPDETKPVPAGLDWDLWLGPAPQRPFHDTYLPFNWRGWSDFGTGGLGDMACHILDPIYWALDLQYPATVEAEGDPKTNPEGFQNRLTVKYEFPDRGEQAYQKAVTVYWHHGGDNIPPAKKIPGVEFPPDLKVPGEAVAFIGGKGVVIGDRGAGVIAVLPRDDFKDYKPPEPEGGVDHADEWIRACKEGTPTGSNFDYAARLTETVLLGNLAWRVGKRLEWDAENGKATNCPEADAYIRREYRKGWSL